MGEKGALEAKEVKALLEELVISISQSHFKKHFLQALERKTIKNRDSN